jgi:hypothetical protein
MRRRTRSASGGPSDTIDPEGSRVNTHLEIKTLPSGAYEVKAVQGQVVTRHRLTVDLAFLDRLGLSGVDGYDVVREVSEILIGRTALTALPEEATIEQLVVYYPYLAEELQQRLRPGTAGLPGVESVRVIPVPIEDHPTHT